MPRKADTAQMVVRVSRPMADRIDALARRLAESPTEELQAAARLGLLSVRIKRSAVVRMALERGLEALERETKRTRA